MIIISLIAQWHFIFNVIAEMSDTLGIRVFCVKDKNYQALQSQLTSEDKIFDNNPPVAKEAKGHELADMQINDQLDTSIDCV